MWICSHCTLSNNDHNAVCAACGSARQDRKALLISKTGRVEAAAPPFQHTIARNSPPTRQQQRRGPFERCCLGLSGAALLCVTVPLMILNLIATPVFFVATVVLKFTCCKYCCPESCNSATKQFVKTPFRWMKICWTGKGYAGCCGEENHEPLPQLMIAQSAAAV